MAHFDSYEIDAIASGYQQMTRPIRYMVELFKSITMPCKGNLPLSLEVYRCRIMTPLFVYHVPVKSYSTCFSHISAMHPIKNITGSE